MAKSPSQMISDLTLHDKPYFRTLVTHLTSVTESTRYSGAVAIRGLGTYGHASRVIAELESAGAMEKVPLGSGYKRVSLDLTKDPLLASLEINGRPITQRKNPIIITAAYRPTSLFFSAFLPVYSQFLKSGRKSMKVRKGTLIPPAPAANQPSP